MAFPKDPIMCMSMVNTLLRDGDGDFEELCARHDENPEAVKAALAAAGYAYDPDARRFAPM